MILTHPADSVAPLASSPSDEVSDFPFARCGLRPANTQDLVFWVSAGLSVPEQRERQALRNFPSVQNLAYALVKGLIDAIRKTDLGLLLWEA
jgi:hypothetical protein